MLRRSFIPAINTVLGHFPFSPRIQFRHFGQDADSSIYLSTQHNHGPALAEDLLELAAGNRSEFTKVHDDWKAHEPKEEIAEAIDDYLGFYEPIRSPGRIVLNEKRLLSLALYLCDNLNMHWSGHRALNPAEVLLLISLTVLKTLLHEYFHYFMDLTSFLYGIGYKYTIREEALAVAFSLHYLTGSADNWPAPKAFRLRVKVPFRGDSWESSLDHFRNPCPCGGHSILEYVCSKLYSYSAVGYRDHGHYSNMRDVLEEASRMLQSTGRLRALAGVEWPTLVGSQLAEVFSHDTVVACV